MGNMRRSVKATQLQMRTLGFHVDASTVLVEGKFDGTIVDNGTGDYTITFAQPFSRVPLVLCQLHSVGVCEIAAVDESSVQVNIFDVDGTTPADSALDILVYGSDVVDQY